MSITPQIDFSTALTGLFDLRGKTAYVPGGYGGIGEAIAWGLAMAGARVAVSGRDEAKARGRGLQPCRRRGTRPWAWPWTRIRCRRCRRPSTRWPRSGAASTSWSTASACSASRPLLEVTEEAFDEVLQVNLKAAMFLAQAAAKKQIAGGKGGAQVHLLSVRAQLGLRGRGYSAYSSSKGGLVMLIRQHASELAPHGITVNGIAPTVVQTEMARHWLENPETRKQVLERIPLGRVADPQDVAGAAVFLRRPPRVS